MSQPQTPTVLPGPLPPNVVKRLTLAKYQLLRARLQLSLPTEFNAWQASVVLHDAADTCLLAIADCCDIQRGTMNKPVSLHRYADLLEKKTGRSFYDAAAVEDVVEVRNPAKHRGGFPSVTDVRALVERVALLLDRNCQTYLGTPLSAISLADMVEDTDVRTLVKTAEMHTEQAKYTDAAIALKHAWLIAISRFRDRFFDHALPSPRFPISVRSGSGAGKEISRVIERWWEGLGRTLDLLVLGVDLTRHAAFEGNTPIVHLTETGQAMVYLTGEEPAMHTLESAEFNLSFVLDTVVRLQEVERVPKRSSYYVIRMKTEAEYFDANNSEYNSVGRLAPGETIQGARLALGPGAGNSWTWKDPQTNHTYLIPFEAAEIVRVTTRAEYERAVARRQTKRGQP